ncbi:hypothetical protein GE061_018677 [Apolygus lucorum]|uniref:HAT C-terminal dimerisation domain-containing protein n=1 Tax=Apolygus lucorum TaxID=248454 RepID=A0A8S9XFW4_APOLU|nr:hypothetical protein GE061_018677 [Apolygus lucorum]
MGADIEIEVNDEEGWVFFGDYLAAPDADRFLDGAVAALSYPKFKKKWFPLIEQQAQDNLKIHFKSRIYNYLAKELRDSENAENFPMEVENAHPLEEFYDFGTEEVNMPPDGLDYKAQSIMEAYFNDQRTGLETLDIYPSVNHIFKQTNTPLPSSAHVERLFSYATMTNTPKSNRLSDEKFEKRVILRANASS